MIEAEIMILDIRDLSGEAELSCQIYLDHDMKTRPLMTESGTNGDDSRRQKGGGDHARAFWIKRPH
jgi:hypothetical protein